MTAKCETPPGPSRLYRAAGYLAPGLDPAISTITDNSPITPFIPAPALAWPGPPSDWVQRLMGMINRRGSETYTDCIDNS